MSEFNPSRRRFAAATVLTVLLFVLSACGSSDNGGGQGDSDGEQGQSSGSGGGTTQPTLSETTGDMGTTSMGTTSMGTTSMEETTGGPTLATPPRDEVRDGTWRVDDAGTVRFQFTDGGVSLEGVNPNSGWEQRIASQSSDELEVRFTRDDTDWKFEVEVDGGQAEISTERDVQSADGGSYRVGDAARVWFDSEDDTLSLNSLELRDGWRVIEQDESSDEIELDFANGNVTAEFEAEQSDGQTELETSQKVSGPVPD